MNEKKEKLILMCIIVWQIHTALYPYTLGKVFPLKARCGPEGG